MMSQTIYILRPLRQGLERIDFIAVSEHEPSDSKTCTHVKKVRAHDLQTDEPI